ncbi:MAG: diguanylate cyclase [Desulfurivibrio sp.]|nr:diguanylate cyclase [Desulfurivibrio sp.]
MVFEISMESPANKIYSVICKLCRTLFNFSQKFIRILRFSFQKRSSVLAITSMLSCHKGFPDKHQPAIFSMTNPQDLHLEPPEEPGRILIVDDSPSVLAALENQLGHAGYEYISARDGCEAMDILKNTSNICLIISDWLMPNMDGMELLSQVRQASLLENLPFLMVTGLDSTEDAVLALRKGANDYIKKPYHPEELLARVTNLVKMWEFEKKLHRQAAFDELTGLYNRNSFKIILDTEIARAKRYGNALTLIMFDIDFFKKTNDRHGHLAGDLVLRDLGTFTKKHVRNVDYPCRYGGEEFALILPSTELSGATVLAERLCENIRLLAIPVSEKDSLSLTCSFGVTEFITGEDDYDSLVRRTDSALYTSKKNGRNRVTIATFEKS